MVKRRGQMAESMRKSLTDETARVEDRFAKAEAFFGDPTPAAHDEPPAHTQSLVPKVIRDTFSLPPADYALLEQLRTRALALGQVVNKSEFVRAGLHALIDMSEPDFRLAIAQVEKMKPGRPKPKY
jgi:hypothetical protein